MEIYWNVLAEVMLDAEIDMNNRHLTYIEEDMQYLVLTSKSMILGRDTKMVEGNIMEEKEEDRGR